MCRSVSQAKVSRKTDRQKPKQTIGNSRRSPYISRRQIPTNHGQDGTPQGDANNTSRVEDPDRHENDDDVENPDIDIDI
jgi:hypothetical protein